MFDLSDGHTLIMDNCTGVIDDCTIQTINYSILQLYDVPTHPKGSDVYNEVVKTLNDLLLGKSVNLLVVPSEELYTVAEVYYADDISINEYLRCQFPTP